MGEGRRKTAVRWWTGNTDWLLSQPSNSRTTAGDVVEECVFVFRFYQSFTKCKWKDHLEGRTETCGERNAVWQLGLGRDVLALFPTGHLARVSQAF